MAAALEVLEDKGLPARRLHVACAFHSPVVAGASARFAQTLARTHVAAPRVPVWSNRTAQPYPSEPSLIRAEMAAQISSPVRFSDQVSAMYAAGARVFVEAGPGRVLTGLADATLGERPHLAVACDGPDGQGLRAFLIALAQLACTGVPVNLSWLFHGRTPATTDAPALAADGRPRWTVDGQLIRDRDGGYLPGANVPPRMIKEFRASAPASPIPATPEEMLAEYLRASQGMAAAQRDVMLSFLGGQPGGPLVGRAAAPAKASVVPATSAPAVAPARVESAAPSPVAPSPVAANGQQAFKNTVLTLISERTGCPVDPIDLDLEADLSIDSIKRAEIAAALIVRLGLAADIGESAPEELVRARAVRAITEWLERKVKQKVKGSSPAKSGASGVPPMRLLPGRVAAASSALLAASVLAGARFVITGRTPVADRLAGLLREAGAQADLRTADATQHGGADGLIMLDGLEERQAALPIAMYPLIRAHLVGTAEGSGPRWVLAAGTRGNPAAAGLAGLFRSMAVEYPEHLVRYAEFAVAADPGTMASALLAELLDNAPEAAVLRDGDERRPARPHSRRPRPGSG